MAAQASGINTDSARMLVLYPQAPYTAYIPKLGTHFGLLQTLLIREIGYAADLSKMALVDSQGNKYAHLSAGHISKIIPSVSVATVRRALAELEERGVVIAVQGLGRFKADRTKCYRLDYAVLASILSEPIGTVSGTAEAPANDGEMVSSGLRATNCASCSHGSAQSDYTNNKKEQIDNENKNIELDIDELLRGL